MFTKMLPTLTALVTLLPLLVAAYIKIMEILKPLLARRKLKVLILADPAMDKDAKAFLESIRKAGYSEATLTRSAHSCVDARAVVLWVPAKDTAALLIAEVQLAAPDAALLILTYDQIQAPRGPQVLLSNSPLRLRADLGAVAEAQ